MQLKSSHTDFVINFNNYYANLSTAFIEVDNKPCPLGDLQITTDVVTIGTKHGAHTGELCSITKDCDEVRIELTGVVYKGSVRAMVAQLEDPKCGINIVSQDVYEVSGCSGKAISLDDYITLRGKPLETVTALDTDTVRDMSIHGAGANAAVLELVRRCDSAWSLDDEIRQLQANLWVRNPNGPTGPDSFTAFNNTIWVSDNTFKLLENAIYALAIDISNTIAFNIVWVHIMHAEGYSLKQCCAYTALTQNQLNEYRNKVTTS